MWPFKRNKKDNAVLDEIQQYYQQEQRERTGIAWLLGIGSLALTVLIAAGLFFGGRWVYRATFKSKKSTTSTNQGKEKQGQEKPNSKPSSPGTEPNNTNTEKVAAPTENGSSAARANTPSRNSSPPLPDTGPGDELPLTPANQQLVKRYSD